MRKIVSGQAFIIFFPLHTHSLCLCLSVSSFFFPFLSFETGSLYIAWYLFTYPETCHVDLASLEYTFESQMLGLKSWTTTSGLLFFSLKYKSFLTSFCKHSFPELVSSSRIYINSAFSYYCHSKLFYCLFYRTLAYYASQCIFSSVL